MNTNLQIILCDSFIPFEQRAAIAANLSTPMIPENLDGCAFDQIKKVLAVQDGVYVTTDERVLLLVPTIISLDNVYLYQSVNIMPLRECTQRILRNGHNIFKLYLSGEFTLDNNQKVGEGMERIILRGHNTKVIPFGKHNRLKDKANIKRIWNIFDEKAIIKNSPFNPFTGERVASIEDAAIEHLQGAFLEDYLHDWKIVSEGIHIYSRVIAAGDPITLLVELNEVTT